MAASQDTRKPSAASGSRRRAMGNRKIRFIHEAEAEVEKALKRLYAMMEPEHRSILHGLIVARVGERMAPDKLAALAAGLVVEAHRREWPAPVEPHA
jgi:hypothetical protein